MSSDCIFCKIVRGEIPCHKIWEDENLLAFLDINPLVEGHTLVIPKKHFQDIFDIDEENISKINEGVKKVTGLMKENLKVDGVNVLNASGKSAQQSVFHIHYHVIPRFENDGLDIFPEKKDVIKELSEIASKIRGK
jgi:histidine triad (HIT) family protein